MAQNIAPVSRPGIHYGTLVELTIMVVVPDTDPVERMPFTLYLADTATDVWDNNYPNVTVTDIATDLLTTSADHRLAVGDRVTIATTTNGITEGVDYYVNLVPSATTFKVVDNQFNFDPGNTSNTFTSGTELSIELDVDKRYAAAGGFLSISEVQNTLETTNSEISVQLSAINPAYVTAILGSPIKGGEIKIKRVFFDLFNGQVDVVDDVQQIYTRFNGFVTNFSLSETIPQSRDESISYVITVMCSSIVGVIQNRLSGRRTNNNLYRDDYEELVFSDSGYTAEHIAKDSTFNRIETLVNASFDFGKPA